MLCIMSISLILKQFANVSNFLAFEESYFFSYSYSGEMQYGKNEIVFLL